MATEGENTGSLAGVRVVDLTRVLSGPFATMLLADQGAEIVKIEPLEGDATRGFGPWLEEDVEQLHSGYFLSINRNKKSIAVDLRKPEGREIVLRLARDADMLVENFRPGVMERLGLSYETLAKENPRLVYGALRGFGDPRSGESPYAGWPAFDVVAQAMGGIMGITGPDAATPTKVGPGVGDLVPALFLAVGLLSALHRARETGRGQFVDIAMYDAIVALCERMVYQYSFTGKPPHPEGNSHPILCPFGLFPVSDGLVSVGCPQDSFWAALCREIGDPALADDPRFATGRARIARRAETEALVASWTRPFDKAGLVARLGGQTRTLMLIGHNPAIQSTALSLIGRGNPELVETIREKYPTATLTVIDFDLRDWSRIEPGSGRVVAVFQPRELHVVDEGAPAEADD
ncbi:MAG: CoA transferase [Rhodoblastus sp.]|nr:CoA transferase [Rhodoblastus sp.]